VSGRRTAGRPASRISFEYRLDVLPELLAVEVGAQYVLVDGVSTMGGTLADLANYVLMNGGQVVGSVVLVNAARRVKSYLRPRLLSC
jgi:orotate phosphoribosyltransferase